MLQMLLDLRNIFNIIQWITPQKVEFWEMKNTYMSKF